MPAHLEIAECVLREVAKVGDFFSGNPYEVIPGAHTTFNPDAYEGLVSVQGVSDFHLQC